MDDTKQTDHSGGNDALQAGGSQARESDVLQAGGSQARESDVLQAGGTQDRESDVLQAAPTAPATEPRFTVGVVAGTHALRGEVRILPRTDFPEERFKAGSKFYLGESGKTPVREVTIAAARPHKQFWLVLFKGVSSIDDVADWKGLVLTIAESDLMPLHEDTYYIHQLVGLRVVSDDGREVGILQEVLQPGANDVYVVRGKLQKADVLIPAIPDCVLAVELESQTMRVHLMPGLLEEDDDTADVGTGAGAGAASHGQTGDEDGTGAGGQTGDEDGVVADRPSTESSGEKGQS